MNGNDGYPNNYILKQKQDYYLMESQDLSKNLNNMNILLVIPRYTKYILTNDINYHYDFPIGFAYISAVLKKEGYSVSVLNLNHISGKIDEIVSNELNKKIYDIVCLGNTYIGLELTKKAIDTVREHKSKPTIILGGLITTESEIMMKLLKPDFIILQEGEESIVELLTCLKEKKSYVDIKGIGYWDSNNNVVLTEPHSPMENLDKLPYTDLEGLGYEEWLDNQCTKDVYNGLIDNPRCYPMIGSRGCAYNCTFCYHMNSKYKLRSIDSIMNELRERVPKYKINVILFHDDLFSANKARIYEFCNKFKEFKKEIPWDIKWGCKLTVNIVDKELITAMKDSGCCQICYGFESMSPKVLKSMNKNFITPEQIKEAYRLTTEAKINAQACFLFGDIAETKETAQETLENWKKYFAGQVQLYFLQPFPGSLIYKHCKTKGIIKDATEFVKNMDETWSNRYNFTESMSDEDFEELEKTLFYYSVKYDKYAVPSLKETSKDIYVVKIKCPYCKTMQVYNKMWIKNKHSFTTRLVCRNCVMHFYMKSLLQKIKISAYVQLKPLIDIYRKGENKLKKRLLLLIKD